MTVMRFAAVEAREGVRLAAAIEDVTGHAASVVLVGDEWEITTDADEQSVQTVVDAHDGTPDPAADPSADLEARLEVLYGGTPTVKDVIAVLIGKDADAKGAVAGRPARD